MARTSHPRLFVLDWKYALTYVSLLVSLSQNLTDSYLRFFTSLFFCQRGFLLFFTSNIYIIYQIFFSKNINETHNEFKTWLSPLNSFDILYCKY